MSTINAESEVRKRYAAGATATFTFTAQARPTDAINSTLSEDQEAAALQVLP